jgi:hypothetical protein
MGKQNLDLIMKFLLALITGTLVLPPAASASTWWLILAGRAGGVSGGPLSIVLEKVPMYDEEQCIAAGEAIFHSDKLTGPNYIHNGWMFENVKYMCVLGK